MRRGRMGICERRSTGISKTDRNEDIKMRQVANLNLYVVEQTSIKVTSRTSHKHPFTTQVVPNYLYDFFGNLFAKLR